jgi:hypothetical protein
MKTFTLILLALLAGACTYVPERGGYGYRSDKHYGDGRHDDGQQRVLVCHKGKKTMELPESALGGHLGHGDHRGPCR